MDTSNPVISSDRRTFSEICNLAQRRVRQNLSYIQTIARDAERFYLPVESELLGEEEVKSLVIRLENSAPKISAEKTGDLDLKVFKLRSESVSICGLLNSSGTPVHPPSLNNSKGRVSVNMQFGGAVYRPLGVRPILQVLGEQFENMPKIAYTYGTWQGFQTRLSQQMGRRVVSVFTTFEKVHGFEPTPRKLMEYLDERMPRRPVQGWPKLDEDLPAHLDKIMITASASAGAPYWRNKVDAMEDILDVGLPTIVRAIKEGTVKKLMQEQPELFLCVVKNKLDRYDISKIDEKTRPYVAVPAHLGLLFSILCQRFQEGLEVFDRNSKSSNAYGFSSADGGLGRLVDWTTSTKEGSIRCICYGDDTRLTVNQKGKIYVIDPDFKQMDGSVDADLIALTIEWIHVHLLKEEGAKENNFWLGVGMLWHFIATSPSFVCNGTRVWAKNSLDGLMTGVPGTTLFDTVKSLLSWHLFIDWLGFSGKNILEPGLAEKWMLENAGLVIKEGTWNPIEVPDPAAMEHGDLFTDHKFLGVQAMKWDWQYGGEWRSTFVPTIPEEDQIGMLLIQKDDPFRKKKSETADQRLLFDRMRGLFLTFGFTNKLITDAIHNVVNQIPATALLMETQLETGEKPDSILLQDFGYPDSSGFPSIDFALKLYSEGFTAEQRKTDWLDIYPGLSESLRNLRLGARKDHRLALEDTSTYNVKSIKTIVKEEKPYSAVLEVMDTTERPTKLVGDANTHSKKIVSGKPEKPVEPHSRSFIGISEDGEIVKPQKNMPNLGQSIRLFVAEGGNVVRVSEIYTKFGIGPTSLLEACSNYGLFVTTFSGDGLCSTLPFMTPAKTAQNEIIAKMREKQNLINKGTRARADALASVPPAPSKQGPVLLPKPIITTSPSSIYVDQEFVESLKTVMIPPATPSELLAVFAVVLQRNGYVFTWKTLSVNPAAHDAVLVSLQVGPTPDPAMFNRGDPTPLSAATVRALTSRLAKEYIAKHVLASLDRAAKSRGRPAMYVKYVQPANVPLLSRNEEPPLPDPNDWSQEVEAGESQIWDPIIPPPSGFEDTPRRWPDFMTQATLEAHGIDPTKDPLLVKQIFAEYVQSWDPDLEGNIVLQDILSSRVNAIVDRYYEEKLWDMFPEDLEVPGAVPIPQPRPKKPVPAPRTFIKSSTSTLSSSLSSGGLSSSTSSIEQIVTKGARTYAQAALPGMSSTVKAARALPVEDRAHGVQLGQKPSTPKQHKLNVKNRERKKARRNELVTIVNGDLFDADGPIAHCVGKDLRMGKGIAKEFKRRFRRPNVSGPCGSCLVQVGGPNKKVVFSLVTKPASSVPGSADQDKYLKYLEQALYGAARYFNDNIIEMEDKVINIPYGMCSDLDAIPPALVMGKLRNVAKETGVRFVMWRTTLK